MKRRTFDPPTARYEYRPRPPRRAQQPSEVAVVEYFTSWYWRPQNGRDDEGRRGFPTAKAAIASALEHGYGAVLRDGEVVARRPR